MMDAALSFYAAQGAALFPLPYGKKAPGSKEFWEVDGRAGSFKHHCSTDPAQWQAWRAQHPDCNFGVVACESGWIITDTDISARDGQTTEEARAEAWSLRCELFKSWGLPVDLMPQVSSPSGAWHDYFSVPPHIDANTLRQPDAIKGRINIRVVGYTVAAGGYYDGTGKSPIAGHYQLFPGVTGTHIAPQALLDHCAPPPPREATTALGSHDKRDVAGLVDWLNERSGFDSYEDWCALGMALALEYGDDGKDIWARSHNETVTPDVIESKWESFATEPTAQSVTLASFMKRAHEQGWTGSLRPSIESMFGGVAQLANSPALAPDLAQVVPLPSTVPLPENPADEEDAANESLYPTPAGGFCNFPETFGDDFLPPDYLVDGILQRRFCYSLTAQTGVGKTTIAMRLAAHVALGKPLGEIDVERGSVLYFAGENPEDVKMRWFGLCKEMSIDPKRTDVTFVYGALHLSKTVDRISRELRAAGKQLSLVVVDTVAAFFEGDNDNDNVQMGNHARALRSLAITIPGGPCVVVLAHPTKNAADDALVPRGGGAFLNEVDGNIALLRNGDTVKAFTLGKFRGPEFAPINFALKVIGDHPRLKDTKGRQIPTIVALPISAAEQERREEKVSRDGHKVLEVLCMNVSGLRLADVARKAGDIHHTTAKRALADLASEKLVECTLKLWKATSKGQTIANSLAQPVAASPVAAPLALAVLGPSGFPGPTRPVTPPIMPPANT